MAEERDLRIQELETLVAQQRAIIEELELAQSASDLQSLKEEVEQLRAIIEAQEEALADQKGIIANQSSLLDELSGQLTRATAMPACIEEEEDEVPSPCDTGSRASNGPSSVPASMRASHHAASGQRGSRPTGGPTRAGGPPGATDVARAGIDRRRAGAPSAAVSRNTGGHSAQRSQREQLLAQKLLNRVGTSSAASVEHVRAPRPNSAGLGRNGTTPRARSLNATPDRGSSGGSQHSARGPSPSCSPDAAQGYHASSGMGVPSRKSGGPLPPALPLLRQEA